MSLHDWLQLQFLLNHTKCTYPFIWALGGSIEHDFHFARIKFICQLDLKLWDQQFMHILFSPHAHLWTLLGGQCYLRLLFLSCWPNGNRRSVHSKNIVLLRLVVSLTLGCLWRLLSTHLLIFNKFINLKGRYCKKMNK